MPNRIVRDGILSSEAVCSLSWAEEIFYRRLMSVADDFGRFHALPKLLRSACYPLQIDKVSDSDIGKWTTACVAAGLVRVYPASDGKRYIEILKFGQQQRAKSKFPPPTDGDNPPLISPDINGYQMPANAHLGVVGVGDVIEKPPQTPPPSGGGDDGNGGNPRRTRRQRVSLQTFVDRCIEAGERPISGHAPLLRYVEQTGLPMEFVQLAWQEFKGEFLPGGSKAAQLQADWRAHFLNFVRKNYLRLWWAKPDGTYELTTPGLQASRVHKEAA